MSTVSSTPLQSALGEIDLAASGADPEVLVAVTELAIEIAKKVERGDESAPYSQWAPKRRYSGAAKP